MSIHYVLAQTPLSGPVTTVCRKDFDEYEIAFLWDDTVTGEPLPDMPVLGICRKCLKQPLGSGILYGIRERKAV